MRSNAGAHDIWRSFAALSLDGIGVARYGDCSLVLRDRLIEHRASVFEDNSAVLLRDRAYRIPPGYRATWEERFRLCVAKLATEIHAGVTPADHPGLLLRQGTTGEDLRAERRPVADALRGPALPVRNHRQILREWLKPLERTESDASDPYPRRSRRWEAVADLRDGDDDPEPTKPE